MMHSGSRRFRYRNAFHRWILVWAVVLAVPALLFAKWVPDPFGVQGVIAAPGQAALLNLVLVVQLIHRHLHLQNPLPGLFQTGLILVTLLLFYGIAGYPVLLSWISKIVPESRRPAGVPGGGPTEPGVSIAVLISAYNEERVIKARLENLLQRLEALPDAFAPAAAPRIEVFLGIDGACDRTGATALDFARRHRQFHVFDFKVRRGKVAILKDLVARSDALQASGLQGGAASRILVFSDANTLFREHALERLLARFADERVGGVCGRLVFRPRTEGDRKDPGCLEKTAEFGEAGQTPGSSTPATAEEGFYWCWESRLKERESQIDSCLGANGAIYAIRRELFWRDIPDNTIVDDFVIGMKVREQGYRMVYEPAAIAEEEYPETAHEWDRRVRIGAGDFQALALCRKCLHPRFGMFAWMFWSHKILRWFAPQLQLLLVLLAWLSLLWPAASARGPLSISICAAAAAVLSGSLAGRLLRHSEAFIVRLLRVCDHFVTMHAAVLIGFLLFCRGNLKGHWQTTPREETPGHLGALPRLERFSA